MLVPADALSDLSYNISTYHSACTVVVEHVKTLITREVVQLELRMVAVRQKASRINIEDAEQI